MSQAELPNDARREARREAAHAYKRSEILAAARKVLARDGAKGLTIRAVASEAGYVAGAVYFYFDSKAAIMGELAIQELSSLTKQIRNEPARDAAERAAAAASAFAAAHTLFTLDSDDELEAGNDRALTGRLIGLFQTLSEPLELSSLPPKQANARALGFSAAAIGLATLARAGRLDKLGVTAADALKELARCLKAN
jgi:AcrR family transcriptional regulator